MCLFAKISLGILGNCATTILQDNAANNDRACTAVQRKCVAVSYHKLESLLRRRCTQTSTAMARPHPLIEPSFTNSSKREVGIFDPSLAPPSALTPGLTPFPDSKTPRVALASIGKRPWVVSAPPRAIPKSNFGEDISSRGWLSSNSSRRGLCATALAFLLVAVLLFVVLGVRKI